MTTGPRRSRPTSIRWWVLPVVAVVTLMVGAAWAGGPQLSITIDNGRTATSAGDTLTYVITVRNLGTSEVTGLVLSQSMPPGLTFESAEPAATARTGGVAWAVDLAVGGEATVRSTATVSETSSDVLRLASVACAATSADEPPIVCATHSDQLPAGAMGQQPLSPEPPSRSSGPWWYLAGGAVLVAAGAALVVRRYHRRAVAASTTAPAREAGSAVRT
jgi:uncharacterized repeat protein (TIGR01451 family)